MARKIFCSLLAPNLEAGKAVRVTTSQRFDAFLSNLKLTEDQRRDGITKHGGVTRVLNSHYYGWNSDSMNRLLVGSWGKSTEVRPPRDIDLLFILPQSVYDRYQQRPGNKQSQLLQEVKGVLATAYPNTNIRGDGPVVLIPFVTFNVELVPSFKQAWTSKYSICITSNGGSYKDFDPNAEISHVSTSSTATNGNTRDLIRMMKCWQKECSVPMKSFWLELLSVNFLSSWEHRGKSSSYYDWMTRDFFAYMIRQANTYLSTPGTYETLWIGDNWKSKVESAYNRAVKACEYELKSETVNAGFEWQKIFGSMIPLA